MEEEPPLETKKGKKGKEKLKKPKPKKKTEEELMQEEEEALRKVEAEKKKAEKLTMWAPYLRNLDDVIQELMVNFVTINQLSFLGEMGDPAVNPLLELTMELHEPNIVFVPSVVIEDPGNFVVFIEGIYDHLFGKRKSCITYFQICWKIFIQWEII